MSGDRPAANRMTLATFKGRLGGAKKGHSLLKKKRDALKARFQLILMDIVQAKLESGQSLKDGAFALAKAHWANTGSDLSATVIERVSKPSVTCKLSQDNIAGVPIPKFTMVHDAAKDAPNQTLGVGHGGAVINATRQEYQKAVFALVKLASLQTMFYTLDLEIKMTSRRVNALEYVLIPKIVAVIAYITQEMDEQSREEFFRVKKVVEKKKQRLAAERLRQLQEAADAEETATGGRTEKQKAPEAAAAAAPAPVPAEPVVSAPAAAPAPAPAAAAAAAPVAASEKRRDPADGQLYTFDQLKKYYAGKYNASVIKEYWETTCVKEDDEGDDDNSPTQSPGKLSKNQKRKAAKAKAAQAVATGMISAAAEAAGKDEDVVFK